MEACNFQGTDMYSYIYMNPKSEKLSMMQTIEIFL